MKIKRMKKRADGGFALIVALLLLIILSALALAITFMTNSDIMVNANTRQIEVADFAAKAGMETARDLMSPVNVNSIYSTLMGAAGPPAVAPLSIPSNATAGVIYVLNEGSQPGTVRPWDSTNPYFDDELCHDGYTIGAWPSSVPSPGIRCTDTPSGSTWYQVVNLTSTNSGGVPFAGTSATLPFLWARITLKLNGSVQNYLVDPSKPASAQVCWNGVTEVVLTGAATCNAMSVAATPVFIITSLAVANPNNPKQSARSLVQAEVSMTSSQPFPYGMFAAGTSCPAITFSGGSKSDSFNSAQGSYAKTNCQTLGTCSTAGGDIGTDGGVSLAGSTTYVYGTISTAGNCDPPVTGGGQSLGVETMAPYIPVVPPAPSPAPPTTNNNYSKSQTLVPGTYGNIKLSGGSTLTMAPGIYNINSISVSGNSTITVSPAGQVILNVAGAGQNKPIDLSGGSVTNNTDIAANFQINYAGSGGVSLSGGTATYIVVNAPNAPVAVSGGSDLYGAIMASSIADSGGTFFHFDTAAYKPQFTANYFSLVSMRQLMY